MTLPRPMLLAGLSLKEFAAVANERIDVLDCSTLEAILGDGSHPVAYRMAKIDQTVIDFMDAVKNGDADLVTEIRKQIHRALENDQKVSSYYVEYALDKIEATLDGTLSDRFPYPNIFGTQRYDRGQRPQEPETHAP